MVRRYRALFSFRSHWPRLVVSVLSVAVVVAVTGGLLYFKRTGENGLAAQRDLAQVSSRMAEQDSQEWRAMAGVAPRHVRTELASARVEIGRLFAGRPLSESGSEADLRDLRRATRTYAAAVDRELSLLEAGDREGALELDESTVDPAFEAVAREVAAATAALQGRARIAKRLSDVGVVAIVMLSSALVIVAGRRRRAADRKGREYAEHLSLHDPLTELPNRRLFLDRVERTIRRHQYNKGSASLLYVDLDDFKAVNDSLGHAAGDELLIAATRRLKDAIYPTDTLCRLGGDEFAVLLENADREAGRRCGERLLAVLTEDFVIAGHQVRVSASVGVAVVDGSWPVASDVLTAADQAMYEAKRGGKGRVVLHEQDMSVAAARHGQLTKALDAGLSTGEVTVAYQPIVDLKSGTTVGVEALARWWNPIWGQVSPAEFIPLAEESRTIDRLGRLVLSTACQDIAVLNAARASWLIPLGVAVNVSTLQLRRGKELLADIEAALHSSGLPPALLTLEITEGTALSVECLPVLHELRGLGLGLALDDFGTGFASLTHVSSLPITQLKIDRSFVATLTGGDGDALAAAILALGEQLSLDVVAEGVETQLQSDRLQELGCRRAQGYLFERPIDIQTLTALQQGAPLQANACQVVPAKT